MNIHEFINTHAVDFSVHLIENADLNLAESELCIKFGPQLSEYLLKYGYLGFESVEMYGMNARQGLKSDMITQTKYLHKYFEATVSYIAFQNFGEGDYALVDSNDFVLLFISEENSLTKTETKLFDYILQQFQAEL